MVFQIELSFGCKFKDFRTRITSPGFISVFIDSRLVLAWKRTRNLKRHSLSSVSSTDALHSGVPKQPKSQFGKYLARFSLTIDRDTKGPIATNSAHSLHLRDFFLVESVWSVGIARGSRCLCNCPAVGFTLPFKLCTIVIKF